MAICSDCSAIAGRSIVIGCMAARVVSPRYQEASDLLDSWCSGRAFTLAKLFCIAIWEETVTDNTSSSNSSTSISGGVNLGADRIDIGGEVVGRDKIVSNVYTGGQQYDVRGLANPYLGLQSFTYESGSKISLTVFEACSIS
jgi:hypothetical protein